MRHRTKGRILNRNMSHRRAMFRNMLVSLFAHERIQTTVAKAKELRPQAEKLITLAKRGALSLESAGDSTEEEKKARADALNVRRRLMTALGGKKVVPIGNEEIHVIDKLLKDIGPRFQNRPGGYTRIVKRTERRLGDSAETAFIELLGASEKVGKEKTSAEAPAPTVAAD